MPEEFKEQNLPEPESSEIELKTDSTEQKDAPALESSEKLVEQKAMAHAWIKNNMAIIVNVLNESREALLEVFRKNPDYLDHFPAPGKDVFRSPLCEGLVRRFPDELLGDIKKVRGSAGEKNREINHSWFMLDKVIIDPTFGQFVVFLEEAIKKHPDLFEEKVLIATLEEIKNIFKINYKISEKSE